MFPSTHQRYLFSRFHHIDELLGEALRALARESGDALFERVIPDATPAQRKVLADYLDQIRYTIKQFIDAQRLEDCADPVSGLWSLRTALVFAQTAVAEMRPAYLRGYGALDDEAVIACERLVAELTALLKRVARYLDKGTEGDLASRLERLDAAQGDVRELRELERIIGAHGIVELRAPLEELVERVAHPRYEVAVFGRVNVGKSSLLNWWLGGPYLPTGVVPVTAVPTRIVHAGQAAARVEIASAKPLVMPLAEVVAYASEAGNPGNSRGVIAITLEVPSGRLAQGVCLVDTPGLGSLATAGARQTLEYLPRCDLAIQLIEAGGAIGREELDLARAILDAGGELLIVLSKADRLTAGELAEARAYTSAQFATELGIPMPVYPVSVVAASVTLAEEWAERQLAPRFADHRARVEAQLRRKIGVLRERVSAALEVRLTIPSGTAQASGPRSGISQEIAAQLRFELERARSELRELIPRIRAGQSWIVDGTAEALTECWLERAPPGGDIPARLEEIIAQRAAAIGDLVADVLTRSRTSIEALLARAPAREMTVAELPQFRGRPLFNTSGLLDRLRLARASWAPSLRFILLAAARTRLNREEVRGALEKRLDTFGQALKLWSGAYLAELGGVVEEALAFTESRARLYAAEPLTPERAEAVRRDLDLLAAKPHPAG
jgi:GTP-binding protein EngB required for normal cell division